MTDWNRFFTGDQLRNAIAAQGELPTATGATFSFLIYDATASQIEWLDIGSVTATVTATATDPGGIAKAWAFWGTASATGLLAGYPAGLSVSRNSAGNYTIDFGDKLFSASNYVFQTGCEQDIGTLEIWSGKNATGPNGMLASSFDAAFVNSGGAAADPGFMTAVFYGVT